MSREARLRQAAQWLLKSADPQSTPAIQADLAEWCAASVENRRAYEDMRSLWQLTGGLHEKAGEIPAVPHGRSFSRRRMWAAACVAGLVAIIAAFALTTRWIWHESPARADLAIATEVGVNRDLVLPDGSNVTIAGGSRLSARYTHDARTLVLERGEAFFRIEPDKNRPFTVNALDTRVTAIGTAFNVRAEHGVVKVAVTEGTVSVDRTQDATPRPEPRTPEVIRLVAGHQVTLSRQQPDPIVVSVDVRSATAWLTGTLRFVDEPLSSVLAAVNRYAKQPVTIEDRRIGEYRFTGTVMAERVDEWLQGLPDVFPVTVVDRAAGRAVVFRSGSAEAP